MPRCTSCASENPVTAKFCVNCGGAIGAATAREGAYAATTAGPTVSSGRDSWSSAQSSDGRLPPGTLLAGRYRIAERLGRGGMGEVYHADDMKLGQAVALKFLPANLQRDSSALARFHHEVRIARQVSHPNVCRVYDIAEADGQHFISMEYVDGEDLKTLLRRIGRLPEDKALQIARQMCAGLAAAHDKGVLHRDLKPANVMLDGDGRVRITDFGLAAIASEISGADLRSGTPGYMAPEQLAGREVSVASDIYSLGLVLFELFTGKPAFKATSLTELRAQQDSGVASLSSHVPTIDRNVERVIVSCLARHPAERPTSALAVAAALPGGDPLAAALAAGETPSPEAVAASAITGTITPARAGLLLAASLISIVVLVKFGGHGMVARRVPLPHEPQVLTAKARDILQSAGVSGTRADYLWGLGENRGYATFLRRSDDRAKWSRLGTGVQSPIHFFYRESPAPLRPRNAISYRMRLDDPVPTTPGTATVWTDTTGQLLRLQIIPPQWNDGSNSAAATTVDWNPLFAAAGLSTASRRDVTPIWNPPLHSDARAAWEIDGAAGGMPLRVEAASYQGKPVAFRVFGPWELPTSSPETPQTGTGTGTVISALIFFVGIPLAAFFIARRNVRLGRSDTRGAFRIVVAFVIMHIAAWTLFTKYAASPADQVEPMMATFAMSLFEGVVLYAFYLALEPLVRRRWPDALVSWARVLSGRLRDPLVGRDILYGSAFAVVAYLWTVGFQVASERMSLQPAWVRLTTLTGVRFLFGEFVDSLSHSLLIPLAILVPLVIAAGLLRREWLAALAVTLLMTLTQIASESRWPEATGFSALWIAGNWAMAIVFLWKFGLLATVVAFAVIGLFMGTPFTSDLSAWHATPTIVSCAFALLLAAYGAHTALAGRPIFGTAWMQE